MAVFDGHRYRQGGEKDVYREESDTEWDPWDAGESGELDELKLEQGEVPPLWARRHNQIEEQCFYYIDSRRNV